MVTDTAVTMSIIPLARPMLGRELKEGTLPPRPASPMGQGYPQQAVSLLPDDHKVVECLYYLTNEWFHAGNINRFTTHYRMHLHMGSIQSEDHARDIRVDCESAQRKGRA